MQCNVNEGISTRELAKYAKSKAITEVQIVDVGNGNYRLFVLPAWMKGEKLPVISTRKTPREWTNLHRLLDLLTNLFGAIRMAPISITPEKKETTT